MLDQRFGPAELPAEAETLAAIIAALPEIPWLASRSNLSILWLEVIGELKRASQTLGLTPQEVAHRMGTDRANVHRLGQCSGNPTIATLARYAQAIGSRMVITLEPAACPGSAA